MERGLGKGWASRQIASNENQTSGKRGPGSIYGQSAFSKKGERKKLVSSDLGKGWNGIGRSYFNLQMKTTSYTGWGVDVRGGLGDADVDNSTPDELKIANSQVLSR